jgi:hypothetical protein
VGRSLPSATFENRMALGTINERRNANMKTFILQALTLHSYSLEVTTFLLPVLVLMTE